MTKNLTVRLPDDLAADAEAVARAEGTSLNETIKDALADAVERRRKDPEFKQRLRDIVKQDRELLAGGARSLMATNMRIDTQPARLLPSGSGWFMTRKSARSKYSTVTSPVVRARRVTAWTSGGSALLAPGVLRRAACVDGPISRLRPPVPVERLASPTGGPRRSPRHRPGAPRS